MKVVGLALFLIFAGVLANNNTFSARNYVDESHVEIQSRSGIPAVPEKRSWSWPYPSSTGNHVNYLGVDIWTTNVNVAGTGSNVAIVQPGSTVSISFNFNSQRNAAGYCPGCIIQWYWGLTHATNPSNPATSYQTPLRHSYNTHANWYSLSSPRSGSFSGSFVAPTHPGIQYVAMGLTLDYVCRDIGFSQCPQHAFAAICVSGDTDGDGVDDCFDTCPCSSGNCPAFASVPSAETIRCDESPEGDAVGRNNYCGASRASTGFQSGITETNDATGTCPETYTRTFSVTDECTGAVTTATQSVTAVSSCDTAVTSGIDASATITQVDDWGFDGAGNPQYRAIVVVTFPSAVNDWRVAINLPNNGDHVVCWGTYCSVYNGAQYSCGTTSPAAFTVMPAGSWVAAVSAGGSVTFEYVATNTQHISNVAASTSLRVYATANS